MEIEFDDVHLVIAAPVAEPAAGKHKHDQRSQQQDSARGRKFFENRPEKLLGYVKVVTAAGQPFRRLGGNVARIEAVTGAGFGFELGPKLSEFETFRDAPPE
jgi:hypothetical protein